MVGSDCQGFGQKAGGQMDWSEFGTVAVGGADPGRDLGLGIGSHREGESDMR